MAQWFQNPQAIALLNSDAPADQVAQAFGKTIPEIEQWITAMQQNIDSGSQAFRAYGPVVKAFTDNFHSLGMLGFTPYMGQEGIDAFRNLGKQLGLNEKELYQSALKNYGKAQPYATNIIGYGTNYEEVMQKTIADALNAKGQKDQADRFVSATKSWVDQGAQQAQKRQSAWDQQVKAMSQGGPSIWNAIGLSLSLATGGWLGALGLSTGTAALDALINQAITQQITNGKIDPESLVVSAALNQAVPIVSEALQEAGVSPDIAKMIVKTGAGAVQGGVPGALGGAGSALTESLTETPKTAETTRTAETTETAAPTVPADVYAPTGELPPATPEVTPPAEEPPSAIPEVTPPAEQPMPPIIPEVTPPAEQLLPFIIPEIVPPTEQPLPPVTPEVILPEEQPMPPVIPEVVPPEEEPLPVIPEVVPPTEELLPPEQVVEQFPDLYPGGKVPEPSQETTYFPTGEAITAEKPVTGEVEPQDLPAYDESGTALTPEQVATKYPDLYPEGKLPAEGETTTYKPGEKGISIPSSLLAQVFNLGMQPTSKSTLSGYGSTSGMFARQPVSVGAPGKAFGEGDVEAPKTGGKRRNVWNVASLRNLQEGLGI